jgi:hypothetical protein
MQLVVVGVVQRAVGRIGEPPVADAAGRTAVAGRVAGERDTERVLPQRLAELGDDLRGGVGEPVEDAQHARADVFAARAGRGRVVPGEAEQVVTFLPGQVQALGDRGDQAIRRVRPALTFQPAVVVGGEVAERGDLLAAQTAGAAPLPARQADVLGLQRLTAAAQELGESRPIDHG